MKSRINGDSDRKRSFYDNDPKSGNVSDRHRQRSRSNERYLKRNNLSDENRMQYHASSRDIRNDSDDRNLTELFVGNVSATDISETTLENFLNNAMRNSGLVGPMDNPVVRCRMSDKFCFALFRTIEDTNKGLNLNGIPFLGNMLKIGRPTKYRGPATRSLTWQQLIGQESYKTINNTVDNEKVVSNSDSRMYRNLTVVLYVPEEDVSESGLRDFLGGALQKLGLSHSGIQNPVLNVRLHGRRQVSIEMRTVEDACNMLNLSRIPFMGQRLNILRHSPFDEGNCLVEYYNWDEVYDLWMNGDLKMLTAGSPSCVLVMTNMASADELANTELCEEILADISLECSQYGTVIEVLCPVEDRIFVEMSSTPEAVRVLLALKGRTFDDRTVDVTFYPESAFRNDNFTYNSTPLVITKSHGPVTIETVLNEHAVAKIRNSQQLTDGI